MGQFMEFAEILEGKIRQELERANFQATPHTPSQCQNGDTDPAHLAFILAQMSKGSLPPNLKKTRQNPYGKGPSSTKPPTKPRLESQRKAHILTEAQTKAVDFFRQHGAALPLAFNHAELKTGFRQLAKKLHPDLNQSGGEAFIELKGHWALLSSLFTGCVDNECA